MNQPCKQLIAALILLQSGIFTATCNAQSFWEKAKSRIQGKLDSLVNKKSNDAIDKTTNKVFGGTNNSATAQNAAATTDTSKKGAPLNTQILEKDLYQNTTNPPLDSNNTIIMIGKNLLINIKGKYPEGYAPKWRRVVDTWTELDFDKEDYVNPTTYVKHQSKSIALSGYEDKAILAFNAFSGCDCYAEIKIDKFTVLTEKPQVFRVTNFKKVLNGKITGEKCRASYNSSVLNGGLEGKITLAANNNGDVTMDLMIENYSEETKTQFYDAATHGYPLKVHPPEVTYRYLVNGIILNNDMSAEKANEIIAAEKAAKQKQIDFVNNSKRQVDSLMKVIAKKYTGTECRSCFYRSRDYSIDPKTTDYYYVNGGGYAGSNTDYNMNTSLVIKNKCNYKITFVGIQQLYEEGKGYYYKDVTKTMDAGYQYSVQQGIFSFAFTSVLGMNKDFDLQEEYYIGGASLNSIQWLKVYRSK